MDQGEETIGSSPDSGGSDRFLRGGDAPSAESTFRGDGTLSAAGTGEHESNAGASPTAGSHVLRPEEHQVGRRLAALLLAAYVGYWIYLTLAVSLGTIVNGLLDDSFYYLQVARNLAAGLGSTFDGVEATNGYHPLWMMLLVPVYAVFPGDEAPLRAALVLGATFGFGFLLSIHRILGSAAGAWAAAIGLLLFAWPRFFGQTVSLLETSLLLFVHITAIGLWMRWSEERPGRYDRPIRSSLLFGLCLGLACLARLDSVFLLIAFTVVALIEWARRGSVWPWDRSAAIWRIALPMAIAALVVLPYLAWNLFEFGHLQPVSGSMKSTFPQPSFHGRYLREFPEFIALCALGTGFFLFSLRKQCSAFLRILGIFGLAGMLHMAYTLLFMCWGVDRWHFGILIPIAVLGIPYLAELGLRRSGWGSVRVRTAALALGVVAAVGVQAFSLLLREGRYLDVTRHLAYWARTALPEDAVVAATDTGVFAYFSERTTINLDGLINNYRYREMLRTGRFTEYLAQRGVGYILDQNMFGNQAWISGQYHSRPYRVWLHPENRVAGEITLYREDEVARIQTESRFADATREVAPNAIVLWRYRNVRQ